MDALCCCNINQGTEKRHGEWKQVETHRHTTTCHPLLKILYNIVSATLQGHFLTKRNSNAKWRTMAAMVPHSQRRRIQQSPRMLADCRMRRSRE